MVYLFKFQAYFILNIFGNVHQQVDVTQAPLWRWETEGTGRETEAAGSHTSLTHMYWYIVLWEWMETSASCCNGRFSVNEWNDWTWLRPGGFEDHVSVSQGSHMLVKRINWKRCVCVCVHQVQLYLWGLCGKIYLLWGQCAGVQTVGGCPGVQDVVWS